MTAVVGLLLAGCGEDEGEDDTAQEDPATEDQAEGEDGGESAEEDLEDLMGEEGELEDPNEDVEDGVYRGNGVALPVPEGWSMEPAAFQQGIVAAVSEDGAQQLTAQAMDVEQAEAAGDQSMEFETVLDSVREQVGEEADTDEEVDLDGADRAHQLTYLGMPAQQEGQPDSSVTLVLAEDGGSLIGEFAYSASEEDYDDGVASLLVEEAGFDPDSEPPEMPQPQPAPEGEGEGESDDTDDGE